MFYLKYILAKIYSGKNIFSQKYILAKLSLQHKAECDGTQNFFRYRDRYFFPGPIFFGTGTNTIQKRGEFPGPGQKRYHMGLF